MCGFTIETIVYFAIALVVILGFIALLRYLFYGAPQPGQPPFSLSFGGQYSGIISIVLGVVIAVCILLFILHVAECLTGGGRVGWQGDLHLGLPRLLS